MAVDPPSMFGSIDFCTVNSTCFVAAIFREESIATRVVHRYSNPINSSLCRIMMQTILLYGTLPSQINTGEFE
jgi:hypothetical protein